MNFEVVIFNLILTFFCYMLVPTIIVGTGRILTKKQILKIVIINGAVVWFLFRIVTIALNYESGSGAAVFLWSSVAFYLLRKHCVETCDDSDTTEEDVITQFEEVDFPSVQAQLPQKKKQPLVFVIFALSVLLVGSVIFNVIQFANIQSNTEDIEYDEGNTSSLTFADWNEQNYSYPDDYYENREKAEFLDENIVFVIEGYGNYFFTYDEMISVTRHEEEYSFWAYNIEQARANGYIPAYPN